jgi:hypothetical protein
MDRMVKVFETGSGKWIKVSDDKRFGTDLIFTSDESTATVFSIPSLKEADRYFEQFNTYRRTMRAVPLKSNCEISECNTVKAFLEENWDNLMPDEPEFDSG